MKYVPAKRDAFGLGLFEDFDNWLRPWFGQEDCPSMKTDISEKDGNYLLEIDLPGFDKKDIDVSLENGYLTVTAKREENQEETDKKGNYLRRERRSGSCSRSFYVGENRTEEEISAAYQNGILTLTFPKEEPKKPETKKLIEIK